MPNEKQLDLYLNQKQEPKPDPKPKPKPKPELEPDGDPFKVSVLGLAENWKQRKKDIDLIFFLSASSRYHPSLANLPEPMRAKEEIPMLKEIMEILNKAEIEFTKAQVIKYMEKLNKIAPKEIESDWKNRKDLY